MKVKKCRICQNKKFKLIFSLGKQPLANNLLKNPKDKVKEFPLELIQCTHCKLIQLTYVVDKRKMFDNYLYVPSISKTYLSHFEKISEELINGLKLQPKDLVVDIGGSDGSLLSCFENRGMKVINIEPAKNIESKVLKLNRYFDKRTVREIIKKYGKAKLVCATNVFAHVDNLKEFINCLDILLDDDGVFFAQFPDVRHLLKQNQFDTIYHEHLSYFTKEPLNHLFADSPFELYKVENSDIHGGSMRICVRRRDNPIVEFTRNAKQIKKDLTAYIQKQKKLNKKIVAFGAAAKGMTLLNYCGLDNRTIDYIADGTPYKQNKYSPGSKIKIVPESELLNNSPDIILILAWNFKDEIMTKVNNMFAGKNVPTFVVPIPKMEVVEE